MRRRLSALLLALVVAVTGANVMAELISQELAKTVADNFLALDGDWQGSDEATIQCVEEEGVPAYYIIEYTDGGWILVAAQSSVSPVIGYSTSGRFEAPVPMQAVLKANAQEIVDMARLNVEGEDQAWGRVLQRQPAQVTIDAPDVEPLITVNLNQNAPYNTYCPILSGNHSLVGCVAVAMTQSMMVQQYPLRPVGKHSYNCENTGRHSIDFDKEEPYNWEAIMSCDETGDYKEVARMLYHSGLASNMTYHPQGSGAYETDAIVGLEKFFQYDGEMLELLMKDNYTKEGWLEVLLADLTLGRAVMYFGRDDQTGHCWNIDGWKNSTQMVHVNWGWGGSGDGYFDIEKMRDSFQGLEFPKWNSAIVGIGLPTTAPYGIKLGSTRFVKGTAAGVALTDVTVLCEDEEAKIEFELFGPKNITGKNIPSPYEVRDGKLVSTVAVEDAKKFQYILIKATNTNTGESVEAEFNIRIEDGADVEGVEMCGLMVYPSVATDMLTLEVPVAGGEYAIYSLSGVQVAAGKVGSYKTDIAVSDLSTGAYIVRYVSENNALTTRFIKK